MKDAMEKELLGDLVLSQKEYQEQGAAYGALKF